MTIDMIALAKKHGGKFHGPNIEHLSIPETAFVSMMQEFEAEIRKEFEVSIQYWKDDSAAAWDKCEERRQENLALTAQNAKLMEALEVYKNALSKACGDDEESINNTLESVGALTPQPEKEGEEKDPHQDLLDSWGPSA